MLCKSYSIVLKHISNCFDYLLVSVIGFLAMYHDGVLCATFHDREAILGQNKLFWSVMLLHFYFGLF